MLSILLSNDIVKSNATLGPWSAGPKSLSCVSLKLASNLNAPSMISYLEWTKIVRIKQAARAKLLHVIERSA
jgi:hypothetical protein